MVILLQLWNAFDLNILVSWSPNVPLMRRNINKLVIRILLQVFGLLIGSVQEGILRYLLNE